MSLASEPVVLDDSTDNKNRQKNRDLVSSISIPNIELFYHGPLEYQQTIKRFYKETGVSKSILYDFFRPLGEIKWDLGGVRNYVLFLLSTFEKIPPVTIFLDDDIQVQPVCHERQKPKSSIELMENEIAKTPKKIISGTIEIVPDSSILWRIADYQLNLSYAFMFQKQNFINLWNPATGTFHEDDDSGQQLLKVKSQDLNLIKDSICKIQLHNPFDKIRNFPVAGGFLGFQTKSLLSLPFPRTYNEDFIWAVIAQFNYGFDYVKIDAIGQHRPSTLFNFDSSYINIEEFGELFFYGIFIATEMCNNNADLKELLQSSWFWKKILVERQLEISDLPNQNTLLKSILKKSIVDIKEKEIKEKVCQTLEQLDNFDGILSQIEALVKKFTPSNFVLKINEYWHMIRKWEEVYDEVRNYQRNLTSAKKILIED